MKRIHLIRHAKSSWDDPDLPDRLRTLNARGKNACQIMATKLEGVCDFSHVFCSSARRAQQTIEEIFSHLVGPKCHWSCEPNLYTFDSDDLFAWLKEMDDDVQSVLLIGHNPAFTDFCNKISDANIPNIPTCGYVQLEYHLNSWFDIKANCAELIECIKPKDT